MRILALETSGPCGGIALAEDARLLAEVRLGEGLRHGRDLIAVARRACAEAGWTPADLGLVAVSIGPGSFTGLRIAVIVAKFIAWDTGAKIVAVPTLRVMAENAGLPRGAAPAPGPAAEPARVPPAAEPARMPAPAAEPAAARIACILDAKRGGLYASIFERRGPAPPADRGEAAGPARAPSPELVETFGPALIEPEALAARLRSPAPLGRSPGAPGRSPALVLGRGIVKARPALEGFDLAPEALWDPRPAAVARLGLALAEEGQWADPLRLEPVYIRRPEAEEIWERRLER